VAGRKQRHEAMKSPTISMGGLTRRYRGQLAPLADGFTTVRRVTV
jgi:hypothetical protein